MIYYVEYKTNKNNTLINPQGRLVYNNLLFTEIQLLSFTAEQIFKL